MTMSSPVIEELGERLAALGWVTDLFVGGSMAAGDYVPGVSDLDLVAAVEGAVDAARQSALTSLHHDLDDGSGSKLKLGCVYVDGARLLDSRVRHTTWTHGALVQRILSGVARAELVRHEYAVVGELLTKTRTIEHAAAPTWLIDQLRARRHGERVTSPRVRTALIALSDARRTIASACCRPMPSQ